MGRKKELDLFKVHRRETYSEVIGKLVQRAKDDEADLELSNKVKKSIVRAEKDILSGRVYSTQQAHKMLGI